MENESIGFLQVIVRTANGALPIEGANVSIYEYFPSNEEKPQDKGGLIYSLSTDNNGKTEKIALKTKSKDLSTSYGSPDPYLSYNIKVNKDGYYENRYISAPIFQGITSLQPVELIPIAEYADERDDLPLSSVRFVELT